MLRMLATLNRSLELFSRVQSLRHIKFLSSSSPPKWFDKWPGTCFRVQASAIGCFTQCKWVDDYFSSGALMKSLRQARCQRSGFTRCWCCCGVISSSTLPGIPRYWKQTPRRHTMLHSLLQWLGYRMRLQVFPNCHCSGDSAEIS